MIEYFIEYPEAYIAAAFAMSAITALTLAMAVERLAASLQKTK